MSREILLNTSKQEIARQEAIHEIIYTEEDYVRDLNLLDEVDPSSIRTIYSHTCNELKRRERRTFPYSHNENITIYSFLQSLCEQLNVWMPIYVMISVTMHSTTTKIY